VPRTRAPTFASLLIFFEVIEFQLSLRKLALSKRRFGLAQGRVAERCNYFLVWRE
jgi:hypothetical protein